MSKIDLYNGDCLEIMKNISDKSVDMILCDLPYGTTQNKWDNIIPFKPLWEQYNRIIKDNGAVVLFSQMPFTAELVHSNIKNFKYMWIWYKHYCRGFLNAKKQPLRTTENICVFYKIFAEMFVSIASRINVVVLWSNPLTLSPIGGEDVYILISPTLASKSTLPTFLNVNF